MSRVLILFASSYGQTHAIAAALADRLRIRGHAVELADAESGGAPPAADYDTVILGSRVEFGKHARSIVRYVERQREQLEAMPTAFFSVSMSASDLALGADPNGYMERLFTETRWRPTTAIAFGGALPYRQYGLVLRFVMKQISRAAGHPTDTSRDHELTDWAKVAAFADGLADRLAADGQRRARAIG